MHSFFDPLHQESSVPIAQRFLMLEGKLASSLIEARIHQRMPAAFAEYHDRLTPEWQHAIAAYPSLPLPETCIYFAVSFAYAQLPIGKTFQVLFPARRPEGAVQAPAVLMAIIGEWIPLPMPFVEAGHRSICLFDFPAGVPRMIQQLPEVEQFMQTRTSEHVWLTSEETWQHLVHKRGDG